MKRFVTTVACLALSLGCFVSSRGMGSPAFVNVIEGTVYSPSRVPMPDLWVELQNDINTTYGRTRTSGSGRFQFSGMKAGHYVVRVYTTGTEFLEQTEAVDIVNVVATASDAVYLDINLRPKKDRARSGNPDLVYAQDVPADALKLYRSGLKNLQDKDLAKGRKDLTDAIKIFPTYYDALNTLGCSYVETKEYIKSLPYLIGAIDVNQRSFSSYYALGYAAYRLDQIPDAVRAAGAAVTLNSGSFNAQLLYGTALRIDGKYDAALEALTKAEKLGKASPIAEVHWQLAMTLNRLKRDAEAAQHLEAYLKLAPDAPNRPQVQDLIRKLKGSPRSANFSS